jgi:SSS family solute:Na+ symporter
LVSIFIAYQFTSVVKIWYTIGSIVIPGIIILVISAYYEQFRISNKIALMEGVASVLSSLVWLFVKDNFSLTEVEPMIVGMTVAILIHLFGMYKKRNDNKT